MDVQEGLDQQSFEFAVLQLKFAQPFGFRRIHAAMLAPDFLDWHTGLGLPQETHDLLFAVLTCSHVHHSPG